MATTAEQYELVYQGICAVAAHCDGAQSEDKVGFNGQDTHFGRRVAAVSFDQWTDDVKAEAARIALTYRVQIETYTGLDMGELDVVKDAQDRGTNHTARDTARGYEKRGKHLSARTIDVTRNDAGQVVLGIKWANGDPEFTVFLSAVQALPGRHWNGRAKVNEVLPTPQVDAFVNEWDFTITEAAQALLVAAPPAPIHYNVTLMDNGQKVVIDTPYNPALVEAIRQLPGRAYVAGSINHADVHPAIVAFVQKWDLEIHPDARAACENAQAALEAANAAALVEGDRRVIMAHVSRQKDPGALPPVFLDMLADVLPADVAEKVIVR